MSEAEEVMAEERDWATHSPHLNSQEDSDSVQVQFSAEESLSQVSDGVVENVPVLSTESAPGTPNPPSRGDLCGDEDSSSSSSPSSSEQEDEEEKDREQQSESDRALISVSSGMSLQDRLRRIYEKDSSSSSSSSSSNSARESDGEEEGEEKEEVRLREVQNVLSDSTDTTDSEGEGEEKAEDEDEEVTCLKFEVLDGDRGSSTSSQGQGEEEEMVPIAQCTQEVEGSAQTLQDAEEGERDTEEEDASGEVLSPSGHPLHPQGPPNEEPAELGGPVHRHPLELAGNMGTLQAISDSKLCGTKDLLTVEVRCDSFGTPPVPYNTPVMKRVLEPEGTGERTLVAGGRQRSMSFKQFEEDKSREEDYLGLLGKEIGEELSEYSSDEEADSQAADSWEGNVLVPRASLDTLLVDLSVVEERALRGEDVRKFLAPCIERLQKLVELGDRLVEERESQVQHELEGLRARIQELEANKSNIVGGSSGAEEGDGKSSEEQPQGDRRQREAYKEDEVVEYRLTTQELLQLSWQDRDREWQHARDLKIRELRKILDQQEPKHSFKPELITRQKSGGLDPSLRERLEKVESPIKAMTKGKQQSRLAGSPTQGGALAERGQSPSSFMSAGSSSERSMQRHLERMNSARRLEKEREEVFRSGDKWKGKPTELKPFKVAAQYPEFSPSSTKVAERRGSLIDGVPPQLVKSASSSSRQLFVASPVARRPTTKSTSDSTSSTGTTASGSSGAKAASGTSPSRPARESAPRDGAPSNAQTGIPRLGSGLSPITRTRSGSLLRDGLLPLETSPANGGSPVGSPTRARSMSMSMSPTSAAAEPLSPSSRDRRGSLQSGSSPTPIQRMALQNRLDQLVMDSRFEPGAHVESPDVIARSASGINSPTRHRPRSASTAAVEAVQAAASSDGRSSPVSGPRKGTDSGASAGGGTGSAAAGSGGYLPGSLGERLETFFKTVSRIGSEKYARFTALFHDVVSVRDSALYEISEAAAEEVQVSQLDQKIGRLVRNRKVATKSRVERKSQKQVHAVDTSVRVLLSSPDVTARLLAVLHRHDLATFQELLDMVLFDILRPELQDVRSTFLPRLVQAVLSLQFAEQPSLTVAAALDLLKPGTIFGELLTAYLRHPDIKGWTNQTVSEALQILKSDTLQLEFHPVEVFKSLFGREVSVDEAATNQQVLGEIDKRLVALYERVEMMVNELYHRCRDWPVFLSFMLNMIFLAMRGTSSTVTREQAYSLIGYVVHTYMWEPVLSNWYKGNWDFGLDPTPRNKQNADMALRVMTKLMESAGGVRAAAGGVLSPPLREYISRATPALRRTLCNLGFMTFDPRTSFLVYQYLKEPGPVKVEVRLRSQRLKFLRENLATYSDTVPEVAGMVDGFKFLRRATRKGKLDHVSLEIPREDVISSVQKLLSVSGMDGDSFLLFADTKNMLFDLLRHKPRLSGKTPSDLFSWLAMYTQQTPRNSSTQQTLEQVDQIRGNLEVLLSTNFFNQTQYSTDVITDLLEDLSYVEEVSARFETELQYLNSFLNRIATLRQSFDEQRLMYRACLTRMSTAGTSASSLGSISAGTASSGSGSDETGTYARSLHRLERKKVLVPDKKMASSQKKHTFVELTPGEEGCYTVLITQSPKHTWKGAPKGETTVLQHFDVNFSDLVDMASTHDPDTMLRLGSHTFRAVNLLNLINRKFLH